MVTPPMEDQTDEDFFDKLVDDELGISVSVTGLQESADLDGIADEISIVSSLVNHSLSEPENAPEVVTTESPKRGDVIEPEEVKNEVAEESKSSLPVEPNVSVECVDSAADGNSVNGDKKLESSFGKGSQPARACVKEVQWSSFFTDNTENDLDGFGSYTDVFPGAGNKNDGVIGEEQVGKPSFVSKPQDDFIHRESHQNEAVDTRICSNSAVVCESYSRVCSEKEVFDKDSNNWDYNYITEAHAYSANGAPTTGDQVQYNNEYWQNLHPGWAFDYNTGEWHQIAGYHVDSSISHATVADNLNNYQENGLPDVAGSDALLDQKSEISYFHETPNSVVGTVAEKCTTEFVSNWNGTSQYNTVYPPNWYFYEQYPGWYYDTITQQWHQMDVQFDQMIKTAGNYAEHVSSQKSHGAIFSSGNSFTDKTSTTAFNEPLKMEEYPKQEQGSDWEQPVAGHTVQNLAPASQKEVLYPSWDSVDDVTGKDSSNHQTDRHSFPDGNMYEPTAETNYHSDQQIRFATPEPVSSFVQENHSYESNVNAAKAQSLPFPKGTHDFYQSNVSQVHQASYNDVQYGKQQPSNHLKAGEFSLSSVLCDSAQGRMSEGHPLHALVTFGFGGRLVVMKVNDPFKRNSKLENQDPAGGIISVHNLMDVVVDKSTSGSYRSSHDYFHALRQQSFPGPLVGGNVANKDVQKWIDERIVACESHNVDYKKEELLRMLLSLLKISCLHYGKLRSPFGSEAAAQESDGPESAVTKLFLSSRRNSAQSSDHGVCTQCLQPVPSEAQFKSTADEMQKLLVAGRRLEALQCAEEGQLWGPALVLAGKLGNKFYADTVKQMANHQFISGSPLRTLCLLMAGQPADAFSSASLTSATQIGVAGMSRPSDETCGSSLLDVWEENLAIVVANRTKDDELLIIHLGDCLWKDTGEVAAAHACYLVAETNFEMFSDTASLCLIGADHWKFPRTYASPDAIQRTELYEYSKVLGNSQFILQPFQPYKLIYAHMLAEVGKVSVSLRYCQAILKLLKSAGRTVDVETWKLLASSLEERLRTHQQGGFSSNLAPAKLMGKVLTSIDRSIHRMIGGPLPPLPPVTQDSTQNKETDDQPVPKMSNGSSRMGVASLMPSASMEPISGWTGDNNRMSRHSRSISEPDIGRTPKKDQHAKVSPSDSQDKSSGGGSTLFGRFGSNLLQKAVGMVSRTRQAKLGEENKFYYDEKRKRWVEKGVDPPAEVAELAPPPTTAAFQNVSSYNMNNTSTSESSSPNGVPETKKSSPSEHSSSIPRIPPCKNQFSQHGRVGIRSRYVDTFNKGGGAASTTKFQSPALPAPKPGGSAKFFIPAPAIPAEADVDHSTDASASETSQGSAANENFQSSMSSSLTPPSSLTSSTSSSIRRSPSMSNMTLVNNATGGLGNGPSPLRNHSRAASWDGGYAETFLDNTNLSSPLTETLRNPSLPSSSPGPLLAAPNSMNLPTSAASFGDDLQEVNL